MWRLIAHCLQGRGWGMWQEWKEKQGDRQVVSNSCRNREATIRFRSISSSSLEHESGGLRSGHRETCGPVVALKHGQDAALDGFSIWQKKTSNTKRGFMDQIDDQLHHMKSDKDSDAKHNLSKHCRIYPRNAWCERWRSLLTIGWLHITGMANRPCIGALRRIVIQLHVVV